MEEVCPNANKTTKKHKKMPKYECYGCESVKCAFTMSDKKLAEWIDS